MVFGTRLALQNMSVFTKECTLSPAKEGAFGTAEESAFGHVNKVRLTLRRQPRLALRRKVRLASHKSRLALQDTFSLAKARFACRTQHVDRTGLWVFAQIRKVLDRYARVVSRSLAEQLSSCREGP